MLLLKHSSNPLFVHLTGILSYKTMKTWISRFTNACYGVNSKQRLLVEVFDTAWMLGKEAIELVGGQQPGLRERGDDWVMSQAIIRRLEGRIWNSATKTCEFGESSIPG